MVKLEGAKCPVCTKMLPNIIKHENSKPLDIPCIWCGEIIRIWYYPNLAQRLIIERSDPNTKLQPHLRKLAKKIKAEIKEQ